VRDVLYIADLVDAFEAAISRGDQIAGSIFNIGGGPERAISLLDLIAVLEEFRGRPMQVAYDDWRPGDQRVYVSDVSRAMKLLGWSPKVGVSDGVRRLFDWAHEHKSLLLDVRSLAR
jgi:CDP-paratose 2-epimerase